MTHNPDTLGKWAADIAKGDPEIESLLRGIPGPMCPKIDKWIGRDPYGRRHSLLTGLARLNRYDDIESLYADADAINDERGEMIDGLEECRTALDALRAALTDAIECIREKNAEIATLTQGIRMTPLQLARDHLDPDAPAEVYTAVNAALEAEARSQASPDGTAVDLGVVVDEMCRTLAKYGHRLDMADGTGEVRDALMAESAKIICEEAGDKATAADILREEAYEALAETDPARLYAELAQVASVCLLWMGRIRVRNNNMKEGT